MKYLISILGIISIGLFASCGGDSDTASSEDNTTKEDNGSK